MSKKSKKQRGFGHLRGQNQKPKTSQTQSQQNLNQLLTRALNYHRQGQPEAAVATYEKILATDPHQEEALSN